MVSPWDGTWANIDGQDVKDRGEEGVDVALPFLGAANYYGNLERFVEDVWELDGRGPARWWLR